MECYVSLETQIHHFFHLPFSRFQNFYSGKLGHGTGSSSFTRPPLSTHTITNQDQSQSGPGSGNAGGGNAPGNQFLAPTPVNALRSAPIQSMAAVAAGGGGGGGNVSKPELTANRLQQTHAINIGHPTFRSEFLR